MNSTVNTHIHGNLVNKKTNVQYICAFNNNIIVGICYMFTYK